MKKNYKDYYSYIAIKLLLISFVLSLHSFNLEIKEPSLVKNSSQVQSSTELAYFKDHHDTKIVKRISPLDFALTLPAPLFLIVVVPHQTSTPDFITTKISYYIQTSLARAPPV